MRFMELSKNYKVLVRYDGSRYGGWQKQTKSPTTIQGKIEAVLEKMCGCPIEIAGSGRTDAGVHANGQVFHFKAAVSLQPDEIQNYLNRYLPEDIAVLSVETAPERFHSRLSAKGKRYVYRIWRSEIPPVFERKYVCNLRKLMPEEKEILPDVAAMKTAAKLLLGTHDFKGFTSLKKTKKSTVRTITALTIEERGPEIVITFEGDGFLYHMIRIIVGTLLEVGFGKRSAQSISQVLENGIREQAGFLAPPEGLCLDAVYYE